MIKEQIARIKEYLKELPNNQVVAQDLEYFTFLTTLLPIPGYQQAAQVINKLASDHNLNLLMSELRQSIYQTNKRISTIESDVEKIQEMAHTVSIVTELKEKVDLLITQAKENLPSEFIVETENSSVQTILNHIINADFTSIAANNNSHNHLKNVRIESRNTHLRATDHSSNYLEGTEFKDSKGTVGMNGITQQGSIRVDGNSVSFSPGGQLIFGNQNQVNAICPVCKNDIVADRFIVQQSPYFQCTQCKNVFKTRMQ
ncbi:MAG: hypothetical protein PWQ78_341 [Petrotoga sp.]|nr:hypothetical protein [Petrotoga sp.]